MGCANSKAGGAATTAAYGAPEEGGEANKVVEGEAQDGAPAANGSAVPCTNGGEDAAEEPDASAESAANEENQEAPSSGEKSELNGCAEEVETKQDGDGEEKNESSENADENKESEKATDGEVESEASDSRECSDEATVAE